MTCPGKANVWRQSGAGNGNRDYLGHKNVLKLIYDNCCATWYIKSLNHSLDESISYVKCTSIKLLKVLKILIGTRILVEYLIWPVCLFSPPSPLHLNPKYLEDTTSPTFLCQFLTRTAADPKLHCNVSVMFGQAMEWSHQRHQGRNGVLALRQSNWLPLNRSPSTSQPWTQDKLTASLSLSPRPSVVSSGSYHMGDEGEKRHLGKMVNPLLGTCKSSLTVAYKTPTNRRHTPPQGDYRWIHRLLPSTDNSSPGTSFFPPKPRDQKFCYWSLNRRNSTLPRTCSVQLVWLHLLSHHTRCNFTFWPP